MIVGAVVSIRALSAGGDRASSRSGKPTSCFNPRPQRGGRPQFASLTRDRKEFQSAPSARGATKGNLAMSAATLVSIRALSAGGDKRRRRPRSRTSCFNPRPQRGGRPPVIIRGNIEERFQSAPSARGATLNNRRVQMEYEVSIRALSAGGDPSGGPGSEAAPVSIRALSAGGDDGGAGLLRPRCVSIRALSAGGDSSGSAPRRGGRSFNPRPQRGGRLEDYARMVAWFAFQSAPSARGATPDERALIQGNLVSIRALSAGGDAARYPPRARICGFNPRPQRGGRLDIVLNSPSRSCFNPRPQRGGRRYPGCGSSQPRGFNPRPQRGGRPAPCEAAARHQTFQSAPSARGAT